MQLTRFLLFAIVLGNLLQGCVEPVSKFNALPPGIWRGTLLLDRKPVIKYGDDRDIVKKFDTDSELPFNFEVKYENDTSFYIVIHNAGERIEVRDISFGKDRDTAKDTVVIEFPVYDTQIKAIYEDGVMEGDWIVNYRENYRIPFKAVHGQNLRFEGVGGANPTDFSGTWQCVFEPDTEDRYDAVGLFKQVKDSVVGTFTTETGDYRFLEGKSIGDKLYLSAFDGAHAFMFVAKMMPDSTLTGTFRSGSHYKTQWEARKNKDARLKDAYSLTGVKDNSPLSFSFENEAGKVVSINDPQYKGKIKLIQIMGTWCPNCMDETVFLRDFVKDYSPEDLAVVSVCFERYKDETRSKEMIRKFKERMQIPHEVLYGGHYDKKTAVEKIPQLDKLMSYPTLLIADKSNRIVKIHTGFYGPATPEYTKFKDELGVIVSSLIKNTH